MRVLQGELGLADPAQPVQGLGDHNRDAAAGQLVAQPLQGGRTAGEVGVPGRHVPDRRDLAGKPGLLGLPGAAAGGLRWPVERPQQLRGGLAGVHPGQVDHGIVGERLGDPDVTDPDRHQLPVSPGRVGRRQGFPHRSGLG